MIQFDLPLAFILLPLPLLAHWLWPAYESSRNALRVPFYNHLISSRKNSSHKTGMVLPRKSWQVVLVSFMWCCLIVAAAKPLWLSDPIIIKQSARDLMIIVDLSGSMEEKDFGNEQTISRLEGAKAVMNEFILKRSGDRLALLVFGDAPFLLMPFSDDKDLFIELLNETQTRMAGAKTMLGDAIGFAYKHFLEQTPESDAARISTETSTQYRTVILLTDGNDSGSLIPPLEAAELAAEEAIRVYPILLGRPAATGEQQIDEAALIQIADITGGTFFKAEDESTLRKISQTISQLEPSVFTNTTYQPSQALYFWPLFAGILMALSAHLFMGLRDIGRRRNQETGDQNDH